MIRESDIISIMREAVGKVSEELRILFPLADGEVREIENPAIEYIFGSAQYIKDVLDTYSKCPTTSDESKFPLIALFTPIDEERGGDYASTAKVSLIIACSSRQEWDNEEREEYSFKNILRPIYDRLLAVLLDDGRIDWGYENRIPHNYSENFDYGRYGAYTDSGEEVSEPIDAINIRSLELKVNYPNCR